MTKALLGLSATFAIALVAPTHAQDMGSVSGNVGAGVLMAPEYEGANDYQAVPLLNGRLQQEHYYVELRGLGVRANVSPVPHVEFGPAVGYRFGRDGDVDNTAVSRLDEVDDTLEAGAFIKLPFRGVMSERDELALSAQVMTDVSGGHEGTMVEFGPSYSFAATDALRLTTSLTARYTDDDYASSYFSVSAAESARTGLGQFDAEGGLNSAGVTVAANYALNERWGLVGLAGYQRLLGDAADSSIVEQEGSTSQFIAGVGLSYRF